MSLDLFHTSNQDLAKFQASVERALAGLQGKQLPRGLLLSTIVLAAGSDNVIKHKLGRRYLGYVVCDRNANSQIWTSSTVNSFPEQQLILKTDVQCIITLWVF